MSETMILEGDSLEVLKDLPDNSIDCVVTDPPYGLSFMGKKWDYDVPSIALWTEVLRVLKPGGHLLSFGGTRTYHRMVVAIEDAGFEVRDQIMWIYGSGFPKSLDVSKAIDKAAGVERIVTREGQTKAAEFAGKFDQAASDSRERRDTPATDDAKQWQGFGTALKPANEPIVLARKPLSESTVAKNVLRWGTGALNIDGTRIESTISDQNKMRVPVGKIDSGNVNMHRSGSRTETFEPHTQGRWPANVLFDEEAASALDEQSGVLKSGAWNGVVNKATEAKSKGIEAARQREDRSSDSGGASRFFYVAKASKRERGDGNAHPTVKPIKLMEYLIKLVCPPDGTVLDPFAGSGTTLVAAQNLGFTSIGIEREPEYIKIIEGRTGNKAS